MTIASYTAKAIADPNQTKINTVPGKTFVCSSDDLKRAATAGGLSLNVLNQRVYNLDDSGTSEDEEDSFTHDYNNHSETLDEQLLDDQAKMERAKREYIAIALNANRDPIKPSSACKMRKLVTGDEEQDNEQNHEASITFEVADDGYSRIHRRYSKLTNYEATLSNEAQSFEEVSPGRVYKRRLTAGVGPQISEESLVIYNYAFWTEQSAEPYDSTWLRRSTIVTDLSLDSILPGLLELLLSARRSEWCEAFIRPEAAFGRLGARPRIPPNATIFCLLEVVKVIAKDKISLLSRQPGLAQEMGTAFEDFYEASNEARMRGNHYHEQQQYKAALQRYKSGIRILEALTFKDENEEKKANVLLIKLYNNCARAANALGDPRLALSACKLASLIDDMEPKTHWNRMIAWKKKGHLDRALGTARRALQLFPDPMTRKSFAREADQLKRQLQKQQADLDDLHRIMGRAFLN